MELQRTLWQHPAMIEFRTLSDDHPDLAYSPLLRGALLTLQYAQEHGSIGLTKTKAFKRVFVHWAVALLLKAAAVQFNKTVFLSLFRNSQVELIHVETPDDPARAYIHPSLGVGPMHACSCSKAIAAFAEPQFQDCIIGGTPKAYTEHTKTTEAELRADFARIVVRGCADCDQEIDIGIASVAAPDSIGNIGATFSMGAVGPIRRFGQAQRHAIGVKLIELANRVSGAIQLCNMAEV
jgi:DNA-binding IclR family transcriptional regulator